MYHIDHTSTMRDVLWLVLTLLASAAAAVLLSIDYRRASAHWRARKRWAAARGWRYQPVDAGLPGDWQRGVLAADGPGRARHIATGWLHTVGGPRQARVFDHDCHGQTRHTIVGAQCSGTVEGLVVELWLPTEPLPDPAELDLLGPVGGRYAFTTDVATARPLIVPALADNADEAGDDVAAVWLEGGWVLAALPPPPTDQRTDPGRALAAPRRLEPLLRVLGAIADDLDVDRDRASAPETAAG